MLAICQSFLSVWSCIHPVGFTARNLVQRLSGTSENPDMERETYVYGQFGADVSPHAFSEVATRKWGTFNTD